MANDDLPRVEARTRAEWRAWLRANHAASGSIWLVYYKKASGKGDLDYAAIVEEALCFGWIDSVPRVLGEERAMLRISPRKAGSAWSRVNQARVERLIADGRMTPAGMAKVEAAKADGSWSALDDAEAGVMPPDLGAALDANPAARANFDAFPPGSRKIILQWVTGAKRAETRAARVAESVRLAAENVRANHWRRTK